MIRWNVVIKVVAIVCSSIFLLLLFTGVVKIVFRINTRDTIVCSTYTQIGLDIMDADYYFIDTSDAVTCI